MYSPSSHSNALLELRNLQVSFLTEAGVVSVVDRVSIQIPRGRTVALVGESGCGKSVTALSILRLIPQPPGRVDAGRIWFSGSPGEEPIDLLELNERRMREIRGRRIAMIFQDPMTSLNPVYSIGEQIVEAIELHQPLRGRAAWAAAIELLRRVGIAAAEQRAHDYAHQMSGGMRQRVMIAMALSCQPSLLIADEPTTALDVTIQLQILQRLRALQADSRMSILLITHDLGVVAEVADDVYVMYAGRIVEHGPAAGVLHRPLHPYTQGLLRCSPQLARPKERLEVIPGGVPDPGHYPSACRFHPRCRLSAERARDGSRSTIAVAPEIAGRRLRRCVEAFDAEPSGAPSLRELEPNHHVACWEANSVDGVTAELEGVSRAG